MQVTDSRLEHRKFTHLLGSSLDLMAEILHSSSVLQEHCEQGLGLQTNVD